MTFVRALPSTHRLLRIFLGIYLLIWKRYRQNHSGKWRYSSPGGSGQYLPLVGRWGKEDTIGRYLTLKTNQGGRQSGQVWKAALRNRTSRADVTYLSSMWANLQGSWLAIESNKKGRPEITVPSFLDNWIGSWASECHAGSWRLLSTDIQLQTKTICQSRKIIE